MENNIDHKIACAGIIVLSQNDNNYETIVVKSKTNYGFPKGKREKGETLMQTAFRELFEETGVSNKNIELFQNVSFDEESIKGNVCVRYFVARFIGNKTDLIFDKDELTEVKWMNVCDAYKILKIKNRDKILFNAVEFVNKL